MTKELLPGCPSKALVKRVRSHLWLFGIRPKHEPWRLAWQWAHEITLSYYYPRWPLASEIASQYVLILLYHMKSSVSLKLPHRASTVVPDGVKRLITEPLDFKDPLKLEQK